MSEKPIKELIYLLELANDENTKAILLQMYIQQHGPVPNEYGDVVRKLLEKGD